MIRLLFIVSCLVLAYTSGAQGVKIKTLSFDKLYFTGINPAGELYVVADGKVIRYDKNGQVLQSIVFTKAHQLTQFDVWHLTQVVFYDRANQQILMYNPELELRQSFTIDSVFAIEPQWVAAAFDQQHFWIYDHADGSIKKVNYKTQEVVVDERIEAFNIQNEKLLNIREYQRFLFVHTTQGLHIFSAMGRYIRKVELKPGQSFDFFGEDLTITRGDQLDMMSLFNNDLRTKSTFKAFDKVFLTDDRLFGVKGNSFEIFEFNPE